MAAIEKENIELTEGWPGVSYRVLVDENQGAATTTMGELILQPGGCLNRHYHYIEESFFVTEGTGTVSCGEETFEAGVGSALHAPARIVHGFENTSDAPWHVIFMYPSLQPEMIFVEE